jgi:hypothetical protein
VVGTTVSGGLADRRLATGIICTIAAVYLQLAARVPDAYANCHVQAAGLRCVQLVLGSSNCGSPKDSRHAVTRVPEF